MHKYSEQEIISHIYANDREGRDRARYLRYGVKGGTRLPKGFELYFVYPQVFVTAIVFP